MEIEAILITHCHFDHIGAVAPVASATGAPVYCPQIERRCWRHHAWTLPGSARSRAGSPSTRSPGGERLQLAGIEFEVLFTPGHSPGHVTYAISPLRPAGARAGDRRGRRPAAVAGRSAPALLSGDVLFQGSVGRVDLPGGDWERSSARSRADSALPARDHGVSGAHGRRRRWGASCRPTRSWPSSAPRRSGRARRAIKAPRGTHDVLGEQAAARAGLEGGRARSWRARGTSGSRPPRSRRPSCSRAAWAPRRTSCRRRCTRSPTAAALDDAAPGGHGAGVPGVRGARDAQAAPAGEAVVPVELLPLRARAGGPPAAVLAGGRGGAGQGGTGGGRGVDRAARDAAGGDGRKRGAPAPLEPRRPESRERTASACRSTCARTRRSWRTRSGSGSS